MIREVSRERRRRAQTLLGLIAALIVLCAASIQCRSQRPAMPVFLVLVDTLRRDALGCYGDSQGASPNIDALAADGVFFDQAISSSGWTVPSVASLLTGARPPLHGAGRGSSGRLIPIRSEMETVAEVLRRAGYKTIAVANAAFVSPLLHMDRGFDVFDHRHSYNSNVRRADETVDRVLDHLSRAKGENVFFLVHLFDPHLNYDPPALFASGFSEGSLDMETCRSMAASGEGGVPVASDLDLIRGLYRAEVSFVDAQVGRLVRELKDAGLYERSLVILTSDHGEEFWDHGGFEHGHTLYDELVRVPLILKPPGSFRLDSSSIDVQVRSIDVMPTVLDFAELDAPSIWEGGSLLPLLRGESDEDRPALSASTLYGPELISLRADGYKFIQRIGARTCEDGELYDWRLDPLERRNLVAEYPQVAARFHSRLSRLYVELTNRARNLSSPNPVDLSPAHVGMLKSLGYIRE